MRITPLADPVVNNVTTTAQYVKNGDFIELFVICDQPNYSVFANFSTLDDAFMPADEKILDYNNGTYRVNYTLNLLNTRSDATYQVLINVTNTTTSEFTVYADLNLTLDNTLPSIAAIASPGEGAYLKGNHTLQAVAADAGTGVQYVEFWLDDAGNGTLLDVDYGAPYNYTWDTNATPEGPHALFVRVYDLAGNANTSLAINITLDNTIPSVATIASPGEGAYLKGNHTLQAVAVDGETGIASVEFWLDDAGNGTLLDVDYGAPYNYTWNTNSTPEGPHALFVRVYDLAGNANTSLAINITIDNTIPNITDILITKISGKFFVITGNASGTFSPISYFDYNMTQFSLIQDPKGKLSGFFTLVNVIELDEGFNVLAITINDSVDFKNSKNLTLLVDTKPPTYDKINHTPAGPEYDEYVTVTIYNASDAVTGVKNITLYYTIDQGNFWTPVNITANRSAIIPQFPYNTEVIYKIILFDNFENNETSANHTYIVNDTKPPIFGAIQRTPQAPTQHMQVNISVAFVNDSGSGIASVLLNYSVDGGSTWGWINITQSNWGIIGAQPQHSTVHYQIIVIDNAGNMNASAILVYHVSFDFTRLLIIIIIIGAVTGISTYTGRVYYIKRKRKSLQLEFLNQKNDFRTYIDYRLTEIDIILNDINMIESKLDPLLKYQWIAQKAKLKEEFSNGFQLIKQYVGISQLSTEITDLKIDLDIKVKEIDKKFHLLNPFNQISQEITRFDQKLDAAKFSLNRLNKALKMKYSYDYYIEEVESQQKVEFPLEAFDQLLAKCLNTFQVKYEALAKILDQLLISREIKVIEKQIGELELVFKETDDWLQKAEKWSKKLPLPKDRGYKYLLKLKNEQYSAVKNEFGMKVEKFRAELMSSITFAQNFINWNLENLQKRLRKFETVIYEDALRYISSEDANIASIDLFIEEKFNYFNSLLIGDKTKVDEFYETHEEFYIQDLYEEWVALVEEIPAKLEELRHGIDAFIQPLHRLFKLIKGTTVNFYKESIAEIEKHIESERIPTEATDKLSPLSILFSHTVWKINRIDNEINDWINLLPFDLETPQLMILLREWNDTKEEVLGKLNTLSREQKIYKCEIMHEILDPLNEEIWECSNCGAIACNEHLERWYHRKKAPECFKCGKTNTFKLKLITS